MKRALIVDDSKTAQIRLKKMLSPYSLTVDTVLSAEEALGYLTYETPSIIFLDHHMEGMDGLEALKIIKANPSTAMIPVVMYTAQKGDMYVGQARALGALDILSKEIMKASSLERVLSNLGIQDESEQEDTQATAPTSQELVSNAGGNSGETTIEPRNIPVEEASNDDSELSQVRGQIARLFEMHIADVRHQMSDNSRTVVYKISEEIEKTLNKEPTVGDIPLSVVNGEIAAETRRSSIISGSALALLFVAVVILSFQVLSTKNTLNEVVKTNKELLDIQRKDGEMIANLSTGAGANNAANADENTAQYALFDTISWAIGANWGFEYGSAPLDEKRVMNVSNLVYRLANSGFQGTVELAINFGNLCMLRDETGSLQLAPSDLPVEDCTFMEEVNPEMASNDYLSLAYLNFEQSAAPIRNGLIDMEVTTNGFSAPRFEYPEPSMGLTAGVWNNVALKNNHISVSLSYL